jgi:hypothetical protein
MTIDPAKTHYSCGTLAEMARIPVEARPRFLAELPAILDAINQVTEAAETMADRADWKWPFSLLPAQFRRRLFIAAIMAKHSHRYTWIDDDKGLCRFRVMVADDLIFDETRSMKEPRQ